MRSFLESVLLRSWLQRGPLACLLWPLSKLFAFIIHFRFGLRILGYLPQTRLPVPVIVVGNIFIGGTGKTPLVIWLAQQLQQAGWKPGIISRGYGASAENITEVDSTALASVVGDEPLLIALRSACPVLVGRNRVAAAQALLAAHPATDIIISDDGLQHYALARDIEILMFDQRGVGNGWLLPAGPLREPAQRRRDFTVLNSVSETQVAGIGERSIRMQLIPGKAFALNAPGRQMALPELHGKRLTAVAGIGHPERFFTTLRAAGLQVEAISLNDHHVFSAESFQDIDAEYILITEKDAVKCRQIAALQSDARIWVVPVSAHFETDFAAKILEMISEKQHGRTLA